MADNIKLAAIKLKGIGSADREWILRQLTIDERKKLNPVLAELDSIAFDQVLGLDGLVNIAESAVINMQENTVPSSGSQGEFMAPLSLDPDVTNNLRKTLMQHSDMFLSIFASRSTTEDDAFLSQLLDRARLLRITDMAKKGSNAFPPRIANIIRVQLVESAGHGNGRNI